MSKIHWFGDMGYRHNPLTHCPTDDLSYENGRCLCPRKDNFDDDVLLPLVIAQILTL
jgi:hypothetical protein